MKRTGTQLRHLGRSKQHIVVPGPGWENLAGEKWADPEVIYKIDIPGFGGHQQWVERGGLVWTALVFDPSHVTLLFILVTKPRDGHTTIIPILWNRNSFGEGKQEPASARTHIPHHWTKLSPHYQLWMPGDRARCNGQRRAICLAPPSKTW